VIEAGILLELLVVASDAQRSLARSTRLAKLRLGAGSTASILSAPSALSANRSRAIFWPRLAAIEIAPGDANARSIPRAKWSSARPWWGGPRRSASGGVYGAVVVLPDGHRLAANEMVYWTDLKGEALLLNQRDPGHEIHEPLVAKLGSAADRVLVPGQREPRTGGYREAAERALSLAFSLIFASNFCERTVRRHEPRQHGRHQFQRIRD
jgi:hypothetical protein